ncbi:MAG: metallophosphoesterase, partial [Kiritimatiellae bacterium]|nr:metallophosphoesterase [Kiritimatiellia bacterium]
MDITRRGFVGAALAAGVWGGARSRLAAETAAPHMESRHLGGVPKLKFGVVSDVHVRLAADGRTLAAGYETDTLERTFAYFRDQGVDAVMIAGDMADLGLTRELKAVAEAWFKVFPNDRAPDGRKVERLFVFGNHDAFGLKNGGRVFKDANVLAREAMQADPKKAWAECFNEEWQPYYTKNVKGYDFFCSHWQPGIWCNGVAETGCAGCIDAFRDQMKRCDPSRPFFYVQHPHPRDTVYGKCAWGMDDGSATKLLSAFPQAIAFSGHSHEPLTNEKSIWRGAFTSVGTGSLRYLAADALRNFEYTAGYENGRCNVYLPGGVRREDRQAFYAAYDSPKMMSVETNRP